MSKAKFDLVVHKRNKKGYVTGANPYRLLISNGAQLFERPPGSGIFYGSNNEIVKAPKGFVPPEEVSDSEAAEMLAKENEVLKAKLAALEAKSADAVVAEIVKDAPAAPSPSKPSYIKK